MAINRIEELEQYLNLTEKEKQWHESPVSLPLKITDYYMSLIDTTNPSDPLRKQVVPSSSENEERSLESSDPLNEVKNSKFERLIHRYNSRVAFLATDLCAQYCRHCFRRRFTGNMNGPATEEEVTEAAKYISQNSSITEMLLTGGDPLTIELKHLRKMVEIFRYFNPKLIIRICTRIPVVSPDSITDELIDIFKENNSAPYYLMTQFNHPRELTGKAVHAVSKFVDAGIPAMNQTVLLKGVNDNADTLEQLCNGLLMAKIKPYYLFQGDLVTGTSDFRVNIEKGLEIEKELRKRLSGLAMPNYTIDLPDGGGKVPLGECYLSRKENNIWEIRNLYGESRFYPDPAL